MNKLKTKEELQHNKGDCKESRAHFVDFVGNVTYMVTVADIVLQEWIISKEKVDKG